MRIFLALLLVLIFAAPAVAQSPPDIYYNSFEFPDMRTDYGTVGTVIMQSGEQIPPPTNGGFCRGPGTGVCTGFYDEPTQTASRVVNDPANCRNGSQWCARNDMSAGSFPGSTHFTSGYSTGNITQGCTGTHTGCVSTSNTRATNLWYSVWFKFASNFQMRPGNPNNAACQGKFFYLRDFSLTGPDTNIIGYQIGPTSGQTITLYFSAACTGCVGNVGFFNFTPDGAWHQLEVHYHPLGNLAEYWWDGSLKYSGAIGPMPNMAQSVDFNTWGLYINQNQGVNEDRCQAVTTSSFWVDDLAVSTQRIGGGGSPALTPSAPTGVQLTLDWMYRIWAMLVTGMVA
jgi:hypothetical protein